jgi:phytoene dehydrogenase-like protein
MPAQRDIVIVGAGHNGLVTAFYLAKAGLKPLVLEARDEVGGGAITTEFHPGFKCSTLAHSAGPLDSAIASDMQLARRGLELITPEISVTALHPGGRALALYRDVTRAAREIAQWSQADAVRYPEFARVLDRIARVVRQLARMTPPPVDDPSPSDLFNVAGIAKEVRSLGRKDMFRLLRWTPMAVADLVNEWFETDLLRATLASRGIFGALLGPRSAGSGLVMLLRAAADPTPPGSLVTTRGGLGTMAQALAGAAREAGAEIRTRAPVSHVKVRDGQAARVVLSGGETINARVVVSNLDPKRTFLQLVDPVELEPGFLSKVRNYRSKGTLAKVNLALADLPVFTALTRSGIPDSALGGRLHIGPDIDYLERAFDSAKYGEFSPGPYLEATVPTVADPSLAPPGRHVMSVYMQFAPYKLKPTNGGWNAQREALGDAVVRTLAEYAPSLPSLIMGRQVITPLDLEQVYGLTGGHIFHGDLALDQSFMTRPLLGWARYRCPISGLYVCGNGTHPGTGLTGLSGRNAAREILKDLK